MTELLVIPDVPPAKRKLIVTLVELAAPWMSAEPIDGVLAAFESLDLGLARFSPDLDVTWLPYNRAAAADAVWRGVKDRTDVALASVDGTIYATIARTPARGAGTVNRNTATLSLPAKEFAARGLAGVERAIETLSAALPNLSFGTATAAEVIDFPTLFTTPQPPWPLVQTAWLNVIGARMAPTFGGIERLTRAPGHVDVHSDGSIWLRAYADPMRYDTPDAIEGMRALSLYLCATP